MTCDVGGLSILYDDRVLTPRPWTAAQSRWAAELASDVPEGPLLEVCAGVGHIGLLAAVLTGRTLVAVDIDPVAAGFLRRNAEECGVAAEVRVGPMQEQLGPEESFPLVIADPPWVPSAETGTFPEDPLLAIDGGPDGLRLVRTCVDTIASHLAPGGAAVLQVGPGQAGATEAFVRPHADLSVTGVRTYDRGELVRLDRVRHGAGGST